MSNCTGLERLLVSQIVGRWDDFNFLRAFSELDCLAGFATDFWWKDGMVKDALGLMVKPSTRRALARCGSAHLPDGAPYIDPAAFVCMLLLRSGKFRRHRHQLWRIQGASVGRATRRLCERLGAKAVFSYSYYSKWTFEQLDRRVLRLMHQVHPYAPALREIYLQEIEKGSFLSSQLRDEVEISADGEFAEALRDGPPMADWIVAASTFTRDTLISKGIAKEKITIIPYGADLSLFKPPVTEFKVEKPTVLFVGSVCARKGIGYLLRAWKQLRTKNAELLIVGSVPYSPEVRSALSGDGIKVLGRVSDQELRTLYQRADVFCLPSLVEGFGMVFLQSLACGTPILGTNATAAVDILAEFPNVGKVVPVASDRALAEALDEVFTNIRIWRDLRHECVRAGASYTWDRFRERVKDWYRHLPARAID